MLNTHNQEILTAVATWAILLPPIDLYIHQEPVSLIIHKLADASSTLHIT